jgi:type IV pilus assembly protein PilE
MLYSHKELKRISRGFTLIELLVIVLIIGILAAIALPQYQKAVQKSRAYTAVQNVRTLAQAEEVYKLITGDYTKDMSKLDVSVPNTKYFSYNVYYDVVMHAIALSTDGYEIIYFGNWPSYPQYQNKIVCRTSNTNEKGLKICKEIGRDFGVYTWGSGRSVSYLD